VRNVQIVMNSSAFARWWGGARFAGALSVLLFAASVFAQQIGGPSEQPSLFNVLEVNRAAYAGLAVGTAAGPGTPGFATLGVLYGGTPRGLNAWSLEGPLSTRRGRATLATATLLPLPPPGPTAGATALALCGAGDYLECWTLINTDEVQAIPEGFLEWVTDETPVDVDEFNGYAYVEFLVRAAQTADSAFRKAALPSVEYVHLFSRPARYRGKVVEFEGRLKLLRRFDPPESAVARGVRDIYEGWMFNAELIGANPICIIFTELPPGLTVGEKLERKVSFAGYFFKKYRYRARDTQGNQRRDAPLLIGRTVKLLDSGAPVPPAEAEAGWPHDLLPLFLGLVALTVGLVVILTIWFRRSDQSVRRRVAALRRDEGFVPPT